MTTREQVHNGLRQTVVFHARYELEQFNERSEGDYWESAKLPRNTKAHWCGVFALFCLHQAGLALDQGWIVGRGFVAALKLPRVKDPQPGDVCYDDQPYQHYSIVESYDPVTKELVTIDGNQGAPYPIKCRTRQRPKDYVFFSIQPLLDAYQDSDTEPAESPYVVGVDVSHHQTVDSIDWDALGAQAAFLYARATYGTKPDSRFFELVKAAQGVGLRVGAYHFYRQGQPPGDQLQAFSQVCRVANMGAGWLPPAIDLEWNEEYDGPVDPDLYNRSREMALSLKDDWGTFVVYSSPAFIDRLGDPPWLRYGHLWVAHYGVEKPRTPEGVDWTFWQHCSEPMPGVSSRKLDQNFARRDYPVIGDDK